jgi:hypothetical protein
LDVEGAEDAALLGAMATIQRSRPALIIETVPREGSSLHEELHKLGYRVDCKLAERVNDFDTSRIGI